MSPIAAVSMFEGSSLEYRKARASFVSRRLIAAVSAVLLIVPVGVSATTPPLSDEFDTSSSAVYCPDISQTLRRNMRDRQTNPQGQVTEFQLFLASYYDLPEEQVVSGFFGRMTQQYAIQFQREQGFPREAQSGIVGQMTRRAIAQVCGGGGPVPPPIVPQPEIRISSNAPTVTPGGVAIVEWNAINATRCWMQHGPVAGPHHEEHVKLSGSKQFNPYVDYQVIVGCANETQPPKDGPQSSANVVIRVIQVPVPPPSGGIQVTAPNGGEEWDMGVTNTVTWRPYQYNPDINPPRDVTAFLERHVGTKENGEQVFETVGKVQESGKASIHWITGELDSATQGGKYAQPGKYYVRVVNNVTGSWDRSDAPFALRPKPITVQVNGSDASFPINDVNQMITVSWKTVPGVYGCKVSGLKNVSSSAPQPSNGSVSGLVEYTVHAGGGTSYGVHVQCVRDVNGVPRQIAESARFYINYPVSGSPSIRVASPNGGEKIDVTKQFDVSVQIAGLKTLSIALYKNDQWHGWLMKDIDTTSQPDSHYWVHSDTPPIQRFPELMNEILMNESGAIFKIYATGQRKDGQGYVDDKSDSAFRFTGSVSSCQPRIITPDGVTASSPGQGFGWSLKADRIVTWSSPDLPSWARLEKDMINVDKSPAVGTYTFRVVATADCGSGNIGKSERIITLVVENGLAAIDSASLNQKSGGTQTISGTATIGAVGIVISNSGGKVYGSGLVGNNGGKWSHTLPTSLAAGSYTVVINNYFSNVPLTKGTLVVSPVPVAPPPVISYTKQVFAASAGWVVPAGVKTVKVTVIGGAGGSHCEGEVGMGGPGGAGVSIVDVTQGATIQVTVGGRGSGICGFGDAGIGENSSFGGLATATGGTGFSFHNTWPQHIVPGQPGTFTSSGRGAAPDDGARSVYGKGIPTPDGNASSDGAVVIEYGGSIALSRPLIEMHDMIAMTPLSQGAVLGVTTTYDQQQSKLQTGAAGAYVPSEYVLIQNMIDALEKMLTRLN